MTLPPVMISLTTTPLQKFLAQFSMRNTIKKKLAKTVQKKAYFGRRPVGSVRCAYVRASVRNEKRQAITFAHPYQSVPILVSIGSSAAGACDQLLEILIFAQFGRLEWIYCFWKVLGPPCALFAHFICVFCDLLVLTSVF